ncbi:MAG: Hsp20/alpha crystallin family protein [Natronomonas sp.]
MDGNPFEEIERVFDQIQEEFDIEEPLGSGSLPIDVAESDEAFLVRADLPGVDRADIDVQLYGETLQITATREREDTPGEFIRQERPRHPIDRSIRLPGAVDAEGTEADYDDGVLSIRLPKRRVDGGTQIDVD